MCVRERVDTLGYAGAERIHRRVVDGDDADSALFRIVDEFRLDVSSGGSEFSGSARPSPRRIFSLVHL